MKIGRQAYAEMFHLPMDGVVGTDPGLQYEDADAAGRIQARLAAGGAMTGPGTDPARLPLGMGNGQDIAAAVLYLVGPSGGYITGQSLVLDGGFLLS